MSRSVMVRICQEMLSKTLEKFLSRIMEKARAYYKHQTP